ncbi:MAG: TAXI family TRAP transporter solute-binding subunit [Rhodobacteraceae bacterium]|nr:TAXI family TRAP transporter solute-binding subunit [Paracoccaceae bacterium]
MLNTVRDRIAAISMVAVSACGFAASASAQEEIDLIVGPFGTGSYVLSSALEQITKSGESGVIVSASETPGLAYNARRLSSDADIRPKTMMSFTSSIDYLATRGEGPFTEPLPGSMVIANYNLGTVWLATFDENIRTPEDLIGKTIALGRPPQILWTIDPRTIIRHGWQLEDQINIETLGTSEAAQALLNGSVDAAVIGGYANPETRAFLPSPQTVELQASGRTLYHIPWGGEAISTAVEATGMPLIPAVIPAGAVEGIEADMDSFYDAVMWAAYPDFSEEAAYSIARTIIDNIDQFAEYHALGQLMSPTALIYGWKAEDIHPGALRAYREAGLIE